MAERQGGGGAASTLRLEVLAHSRTNAANRPVDAFSSGDAFAAAVAAALFLRGNTSRVEWHAKVHLLSVSSRGGVEHQTSGATSAGRQEPLQARQRPPPSQTTPDTPTTPAPSQERRLICVYTQTFTNK